MFVAFRFSKKTGKVDTTLTSAGAAMLKLWGLQNTTKSKNTIVVNRGTGEVVALYEGADGMPKVSGKDLGMCTEYGIPLEFVQSITDDRFDA